MAQKVKVGQKRLRKLSDNTHESELKKLANDAQLTKTTNEPKVTKTKEPVEESKVKPSTLADTNKAVKEPEESSKSKTQANKKLDSD